MARSRGLSEAQPSVIGPHTIMHLKDAKTGAKATKIRILQMPYAGDNITEGYALRATPPATSLRLMPSASLLSEAPRCQLNLTQISQIKTDYHRNICANPYLLKPPHLLN